MLYRLFQAVFGGLISWFSDRLETKASEKVIQKEQATLDQKTVEAKQTLDELEKLNVLKTTAATKVKDAEAQVLIDEERVVVAQSTLDQAILNQKTKLPNEDITAQQLEDKLREM